MSLTRKEKRRIVYSKMVRVVERLKKYQSLFENNPTDANVKKRISSKLPLFWKMYQKLQKKRAELKFEGEDWSPSKQKWSVSANESTRMDSKDFGADSKSINDNTSLANSLQSLLKSVQTYNYKGERLNDSFDHHNASQFDMKLEEIHLIIVKLEKLVQV